MDDQYIVVIDPSDKDELIEIPMAKDGGTVPLSTLDHAFPGAYGLKYLNPTTGAKRIVPFDELEKRFNAPPGGWTDKKFEIIFRPAPSSTDGNKGTNAVNDDDSKKKGDQKTAMKRKQELNGGEEEEGDEFVGGLGSRSEKGGGELGDEFEGGGAKKAKHSAGADAKLDKYGKDYGDLICMGLPYDLEDWALQEYFEKFGPVEFREIKRKNNGDSRGFGFVRMANYSDQIRALSQPKHIIGGRECNIRISSAEKEVEVAINKMVDSRSNPRLFIGGFSEDITRDRLKDFLLEHLHRFDKNAHIYDFYYPRPFRGFAFLTISSQKAAKELVRQTDFIIDDHACTITLAVPKQDEQKSAAPAQPPQQPWAAQQAPVEPRAPPVEMFAPEQPWNGPGRGGFSRYDDYQPRGVVGPPPNSVGHGDVLYGGPHYETRQNPTMMGYPPQRGGGGGGPPSSYDPRDDMRMVDYQRQLAANPNGGGGFRMGTAPEGPPMGCNIPVAQAEAILNQLPNDAVGTALKMLQSIMAGKQQQQQQHQEDGQQEGGRQSSGM